TKFKPKIGVKRSKIDLEVKSNFKVEDPVSDTEAYSQEKDESDMKKFLNDDSNIIKEPVASSKKKSHGSTKTEVIVKKEISNMKMSDLAVLNFEKPTKRVNKIKVEEPKVISHADNIKPEPIAAPQVKIINGKVVIDQESILVSKKKLHEEPNEIISVVEGDLHMTSSSFAKKNSRSDRWSKFEDELFYKALNVCGTDFGLMSKLFPYRDRVQLKNKFKKEEKFNPRKINEALQSMTRITNELWQELTEISETINQIPINFEYAYNRPLV
ncbi:hypothetical protein ROZALSC1DRAFT_26502, partial [Rozella allomycis CSF55]